MRPSATARGEDLESTVSRSEHAAVLPDDVPAIGATVDGKYEILGVLGKGGMGSVLAARHRILDTQVAIKVLHGKAPRPTATSRFLREARIAARITHANVVRVYDFGTLESGRPFIVMERLFGMDLEKLLALSGPLPIGQAVAHVREACRGVAHAAEQGLVHRDLKPSNLFVCDATSGAAAVKVLDFGLSKLRASAESSEDDLTEDNTLLGSPHYMSPEQLRDCGRLDQRSDVWAFGVILHRLLTGEYPFQGAHFASLVVAIAREAPRDIRPGLAIPRALRRIVSRCLEKAPEHRFSSVSELERELTRFLERRTSFARPARLVLPLALGGAVLGSAALLVPRPTPEVQAPAPSSSAHASTMPAYGTTSAPPVVPLPSTPALRALAAEPSAVAPARRRNGGHGTLRLSRPRAQPTELPAGASAPHAAQSSESSSRPAPSARLPEIAEREADGTLKLRGNPAVADRE